MHYFNNVLRHAGGSMTRHKDALSELLSVVEPDLNISKILHISYVKQHQV